MKKTILLAMFLFLIQIAYAQCPGSATAAGGNITYINITGSIQAGDWQGYAGIITYGTGPTAPTTVNATGSNVSGQGFHFQIPCNNPTSITGFVLFSNSSAAPVGLVPGNLTQLDAFIPGLENGTLTFTQTSTFNFPSAGTVNNVPTTYTYVNSGPQNTSFREGYFNDAAGNLVFATEINFVPPQGYNTSSFSYQAMLAAPNFSTIPYYIFTDLNAVCPRPTPRGGGGSGGRYYPETWRCGNWSRCIDGIQRRNCTQLYRNEYYGSGYFPPTERICGTIHRPEYVQNITEKMIPDIDLDLIIPEKIDAIATRITNFKAKIDNKNEFSIENVGFKLYIPDIISKILPIHQFQNVLWGLININGWSLRLFRQKNYLGKVNLPQPIRVSPKALHTEMIEITPPAMTPQKIDAALTIMAGNQDIVTKNFVLDVDVNEFDAWYDYNAARNIFTLFFIVDNRGKSLMKNAFIEFNLNKGRKTTIAELYGPYNFPEDKVTILAQEYKLSKGLIGKEFEMKANINNGKYFNEVKRKCIISG